MAVAVKNTPEASLRSPLNHLILESFAGACYVLGSLAIVFFAIPSVWAVSVDSWLGQTAVSVALKIVVMVVAAIGLLSLGSQLLTTHPLRGLRAGIFLGLIMVLAIVVLTCGIGNLIQGYSSEGGGVIGLGLTALVGAGLIALAFFAASHARFERLAIQLEEQGWFTVAAYKRTQGLRVRRGTILGLLILAGCGIYTILQHNTLATGAQNWEVPIPFSSGRHLTILPDVRITLPLLLSLGSLWLAYRVVNLPVFADFLIATEAELNKVSWTTRKRLVQDTIVVLVTVFLLTVFLFVVDQAWAFILTRVGVLQITPANAQQLGPKEQPW
jgi:preprotein translocase SecE subunit